MTMTVILIDIIRLLPSVTNVMLLKIIWVSSNCRLICIKKTLRYIEERFQYVLFIVLYITLLYIYLGAKIVIIFKPAAVLV